MEYVTATSGMVNTIYNVLHTTIKTSYAKYYPKGGADLFCQHHSKEYILDGIASGNMGVLVENSVIVGRAAMMIIILWLYMCCLLIISKDSDRILWIAWKLKL